MSEKQQKKVISPGTPCHQSPCHPLTLHLSPSHPPPLLIEHVLEALATLGFPEYIEDVRAVHREYKEQASVGGGLGGWAWLVSCVVTIETSSSW